MTVKVKPKPGAKKTYRRPEVYSPRLRILIDPVYVQSANLTSSSTYYKYVSLVRELVSRGHFVYWCLPDADYVPNEIENHPNVAIIRTSYIQDQFVVDGLFTDDFFNLFNRTSGKYHVDVMCTSRNSLAMMYKRTLDPPRFHEKGEDHEYTDKSYGLPLVLIEEFPQTPERQFTGNAYWLNQLLGYMVSERTIFLSKHNQGEVIKAAYDTLNASAVEDMQNRFRIIPAGIECEQLDKIYKPKRWTVEGDGFDVLCVGRIFGPSYAHLLELTNYMYKLGDSKMTITISLSGALSGPMRKKLQRIGFDLKNNAGRQLRLFENNPRDNFLRMLQKYKAFFCPLSHLDHPTGLFECIYLGLPGAMPVSDYQKSFFPDWPWVFDPKDKAGFLAIMKELKADPAGARKKILPWRERIRELYDAKTNIEVLSDEIEQLARHNINRFRTSSGVIDLCATLKGKSYTWQDTVSYLKSAGKMGVSIGDMTMRTTFTYGRSSINHAMKCAGFVDDCTGPIETFVRRDIFDAANVSSGNEGEE
jgi:glycosyltransferase involved in cell wall biosynthesis